MFILSVTYAIIKTLCHNFGLSLKLTKNNFDKSKYAKIVIISTFCQSRQVEKKDKSKLTRTIVFVNFDLNEKVTI